MSLYNKMTKEDKERLQQSGFIVKESKKDKGPKSYDLVWTFGGRDAEVLLQNKSYSFCAGIRKKYKNNPSYRSGEFVIKLNSK